MSKRIQTIILMLMAVFIAVCIWIGSMVSPLGGGHTSTVQIPKGVTGAEVGRILAEKHVIRSAFGFRLLVRFSRGHLRPGMYDLSSNMSPQSILHKLESGEVSAKWMTFPEGFTVQQIAERLDAGGVGSAEQFEHEALDSGEHFKTKFAHPGESLEGYLFPDTYLIPAGIQEDGVINEMLNSFQEKIAAPLAGDIRASGMSLKEIVTLASLIEREARVHADRPLISAVLRNRIAKGMRLECDATILYALGKHKKRVFYKDLNVDSPYNTYRNAGLPPGPIANPGLDSIKAALHPAKVDYLYYVARPNGTHIFSRTFEEHLHAKKIARRKAASS